MNKLSNKNILFFSPSFFNYEYRIKEKMEELGAIVDLFDERSIDKKFEKALLKIDPYIFQLKTNKYYLNIFKQIQYNNYDYILFIKCEMPSCKILKLYRNHFVNSKFCLYMWDSLKNIPHIHSKLKFFDSISSFDRHDCIKYTQIKFRPLFYCDEYIKSTNSTNHKYDLAFIGTIHSDRYKILKKILNQSEKLNLNIYIYPYLQSKFIYYVYKLIKKEFKDTKINDFKYDKISKNFILEILNQSNFIIDIQHPNQTGLTIRTIEMIGMKKKLLTTNEDIINYDFYNSNNIYILNRNDIKIENKFLKNQEYYNISDNIYNKYSIEYWLYDILN